MPNHFNFPRPDGLGANPQQATNQPDFGPFFVIAAFSLIAFALISAQQQNQIVRPIPFGPSAPVVPDLPDIMAQMSTQKTLCEGRAQAAISILHHQHKGLAKLAEGRRLYDEAQAAFNGNITFLQTGLSRRFVDADVSRIAYRLTEAERKIDRFVTWANSLEGPVYGATSASETLTDWVSRWIDHVSQQNNQAIEQLREDLQNCRLRAWNEL